MFKKINWRYSILAAFIASFLFCICAFIYIKNADYTFSWILYLGSVFYFFTVAIVTVIDNKKRGGNESTVAMVFSSHLITVLGIIMSVIACLILLSLTGPGFGGAQKMMTENPPASSQGFTGGLFFRVIFAAVILNFFGGSIAGITIPFYSKRNQTKDDRAPTPFVKRQAVDEQGKLK